MKVINFHNEKGGVGKTTFSIMYASWLKYRHDIDVAVVDFNSRINNYRQDEIAHKKRAKEYGKYNPDDFWPVLTAKKFEIQERYPGVKAPNAFWLRDEILTGSLKGKEVVIVDLPGATGGREFIELLLSNSIGLYNIIIDRDPQTIRAAMAVFNAINKVKNNARSCGIINQMQTYLSMREYDELKNLFMDKNMPILPDGISYSERIRNIANTDIIRSTIDYPDWNNKMFEGSRDLGTENLFIDITRLLDKCEDYRGTEKTYLTFAEKMKKEFHEKRQFFDTGFPEYEFDKSKFSKSRFKEKPTAHE